MKEEIEHEDELYRLILEPHVDEKGNIKPSAFSFQLLRDGREEKEISLLLKRHTPEPQKEIGTNRQQSKVIKVCAITARALRDLKLGVCHSPSRTSLAHAGACGFLTEEKKVAILMAVSEIID